MLHFDFKKTRKVSWFYTVLVSLVIFIVLNLMKGAIFTKILGVGGVIAGGVSGILILLMAGKAKKLGDRKPEYSIPHSRVLIGVIILVLVIGAILEIINVF